MRKPHVLIVGGGMTGLAAAFELAARRIPFLLLEASPRLGGLLRTEQVDGFTIEAGPDGVLAQKPAALELFTELGLDNQVITTRSPRAAFVLKRGKLYPLPSPSILGIPTTLTGIAGYELLPMRARARVALEPLVRTRSHGDESVSAFFARRFGRATVDLIAEPLLGGIHAGDVGKLSVRSLFPRLVDAEAHGSVLHTFKGRRMDGDGLFRSLAGGMGELTRAIESRLPDGSVRLNAPVSAIARRTSGWSVAAASGTVEADALILATPASVAARLSADADAEIAARCAEVPYVSTVSVALGFPRTAIRHPLNGSGFVVARRFNGLRITACTWVSSKWEGRAPEGSALLRVFVGGAHDPGAVDLDDAQLVELALRDLSGVLGIASSPVLARVHRWRAAGAQHNVGQLARMTAIERRLAEHPGLFVAGSGFRSVGIPDCIADGRAAARAAAAYNDHKAERVDK